MRLSVVSSKTLEVFESLLGLLKFNNGIRQRSCKYVNQIVDDLLMCR